MPLWFKNARHEAVYWELQAKARVTSEQDILQRVADGQKAKQHKAR